MMAENPNWWGVTDNTMHLQSHPYQLSSQFAYASNSPLSYPSPPDHLLSSNGRDFPVRSWSQLILGGLANARDEEEEEEERFGATDVFQQQRKMESWEDQLMFNLNDDPSSLRPVGPLIDVKREISQSDGQFYAGLEEGLDANRVSDSWPFSSRHPQIVPVSSPTSCVTTLSGNILNFSGGIMSKNQIRNQDRSSECNSTGNGGGAVKKARVTKSSAQPALKVRKEKLGDRISTLHQLVSPFGKTDTASVLSEAIGYIRFLHAQIEALSSPYMRTEPESSRSHHQHSFLNDFHIEGRGASNQNSQVAKDLRSRGLCLIPMECIQHVENENGVDYWTETTFGGGF